MPRRAPSNPREEAGRITRGAVLRSFREEKGLSQDDLAHRLGVNQTTIQRIEVPALGVHAVLSEQELQMKILSALKIKAELFERHHLLLEQRVMDIAGPLLGLLPESPSFHVDLVAHVGFEGFASLVAFLRRCPSPQGP